MLAPELAQILSSAFEPCLRFNDSCAGMRWEPDLGFVPRGFLGAFGDPKEVELVLVTAEPGDPWADENYAGLGDAREYLDSTLEYTCRAFSDSGSRYHENVRYILDLCWPDTPFKDQLRKTWITDSVLCSALTEGGSVRKAVCRACGERYLKPQLELFPQALIVALGAKARHRLHDLGLIPNEDFLPAASVAPPGCNYAGARESWEIIPSILREMRRLATEEEEYGRFSPSSVVFYEHLCEPEISTVEGKAVAP